MPSSERVALEHERSVQELGLMGREPEQFGPQRMGMVMGLYALMPGVGAVLGASASFALYQLLGADRTWAFQSLDLWAAPALLALVAWLPQLRHAPGMGAPADGSVTPAVAVYRNCTAWSITLFFGLQVLKLYVFLPWMPTILTDRGATLAAAAQVFSLSQVSLMVASFVAPLLAHRSRDQRPHIVVTVLLRLAGTLGLAYAPIEIALSWAVILGLGQGARCHYSGEHARLHRAGHVRAFHKLPRR
ncbi:MFS transporter [Variovorax ginsengisoli]|uniref:Cyanate permease n=1 Tax=Variovorax ginsengisoli TaxID=363844 RepID=A0ABT9SDK7_9BURK|nr:MFS transporter [Variovorax ginsengisoli]MDP9902439.1 cyanate permease [Variovorax ginsengisoli]